MGGGLALDTAPTTLIPAGSANSCTLFRPLLTAATMRAGVFVGAGGKFSPFCSRSPVPAALPHM